MLQRLDIPYAQAIESQRTIDLLYGWPRVNRWVASYHNSLQVEYEFYEVLDDSQEMAAIFVVRNQPACFHEKEHLVHADVIQKQLLNLCLSPYVSDDQCWYEAAQVAPICSLLLWLRVYSISKLKWLNFFYNQFLFI